MSNAICSIHKKRSGYADQVLTKESSRPIKHCRTSECICSLKNKDGVYVCRYLPVTVELITPREVTKCNEKLVRSYGGHCMQGFAPESSKKGNQDSLLMLEDPQTGALLFACFDGHGQNGDKVSQCVKAKLEKLLFKHALFASDPQAAVVDVISTIADALRSVSDTMGCGHSGTTLALALVKGTSLLTANIGDSRIVLMRQRGSSNKRHSHHNRQRERSTSVGSSSNISISSSSFCSDRQSPDMVVKIPSPNTTEKKPQHQTRLAAHQLTTDHKPDQREEYARILATGGRVFAVRYDDGVVGPARVWFQHTNSPGLAMSRSLGDFAVHSVGVISTPEITWTQLDLSTDYALVVASDGLWDMMNCSEVAATIEKHPDEPHEAVMALLVETHSRWMLKEQMSDDTTICVAYLNCSPFSHCTSKVEVITAGNEDTQLPS